MPELALARRRCSDEIYSLA